MPFATHKDTPGRQAANILELDLDYCSRSYGVSPCAADLALQNFLFPSDDLSDAIWNRQNLTLTVDQDTHPILGGMIVDELLETAVTNVHRTWIRNTSLDPTKIWSGSALVKAINGRVKFRLRMWNNTATVNAFYSDFDIANGTVTAINQESGDAQAMGAKMYFVGDNYWRLIITGIPDILGASTDGVRVDLYGLNPGTSYLGDVTKGMYAGGFQLRKGLYPGKYVQTTSAVVDGLGTVDDLCFNTFGTCQDTTNFNKEVRTLRFIDTLQRPYQFLDSYPAILSVRYAPTVLKPGGNLSIRGQVTVTLQDFSTTDNEIDDYVRERSYDPEDQGTFFGKLKARSQYYIGRPMRVLEGYLDDASLSDFRTREYIIDDISGPTANGQVIIKGKDILSLAADVRAKCPTASTGTVAVLVTAGAGSVTVSTGDGAQYDPTTVDKHIRINDEIMRVDSRATDVLTVTRAQGGTDAAEHAVGDGIQACKTYEDTPVIDVIQELLEDFANIPSSFIPYTDWEAEEAESLSGYDMETIITEPTGVLSLLKEIAEITLIDLWYDDVDQEIKLKLQTPFTEVTETVNDNEHILKGSLKVRDLNNQRLTRVLVYYGIRNYAEKLKDAENFNFINFEIEADKEGVNKYNDERIKVIYSRWFDSTNTTQVELTSTRLLTRFGITPKQIAFNLDAKDVERLTTGDVFDLTSRIEQDANGSDATNRYQVTETKAIKPSSQYAYKAEAFFQDPQPDSLTINQDETDYDIFVELGGPPGPVDVTLTINSTFTVSATNGSPSITTEGMHPDSTLYIINNGDIKGYGGNAGKGGGVVGWYEYEPGLGCIGFENGFDGENGEEGGDAIDTTLDITIDNTNGNIWAGAGGGAGGGADSSYNDYGGGGGGGGGIGTDTGNLGFGGDAKVTNFFGCPVTNTDGNNGTAGSTSAAGLLGTGGGFAGDGGDGGVDWGDDGDDGEDGVGQSKGTGGPGGYAVRLNGNAIIWEGGLTAAKVKGDVA